jgi:hypothetical protein
MTATPPGAPSSLTAPYASASEWPVLIHDHHEGYLSRADYYCTAALGDSARSFP